MLKDLRERIGPLAERQHSDGILIPARERVPIDAAVDMILAVWEARDAKKLTTFFDARGQFWDVRSQLWVTPPEVEKGLLAYFSSAESRGSIPDTRDVKLVTGEVTVVTLVWKPEGEAKKRNVPALRVVLVLRDAQPGWVILSLHLAELNTGF